MTPDAAECGPACSEQHTYRLGECALCCAQIYGGVGDPSWTVACPKCGSPADRPCTRRDGLAVSVSCGERWDRYDAQRKKPSLTPGQPDPAATVRSLPERELHATIRKMARIDPTWFRAAAQAMARIDEAANMSAVLGDAVPAREEDPVDEQEQAAPVDWEAVARRRERELRLVDEARHHAEAEVDRLRAGEEPGWEPMTVPTPGQWIARFNRAGAEERLDVAQRVIGYTATAGTCFEMNHVQRLEEDRQAWVVLARARQEVARWKLNTLEPQTVRALDDIDRALRKDPDPEPAPGFAPARSVARSWGETSGGDPLVVEPYRNDRNQPAWVFRCWGTGSCDGWLSLDHHSQESAERARERHVAEEHAGVRASGGDEALPWSDLRTSGLLWLINRIAFHPRGVALTLHATGGTVHGWSLTRSPGGEPWQFDEETDASGHARAEATLAAALNHPKEQQ